MKIRALAIQALVWALAVGVKWHFASAGPEGLKWLMGPTVALVSFVTRVPFVFESGVGYFSAQAHYAVIPACSGLNFGVVAWVALAWVLAARFDSLKLVFMSGLTALGLTYVANATRLSLAVVMHMSKWSPPLLSPDDAHRLLGVGVYVLALMFVCSVFQNEFNLRKAGLILGSYWFFALALPLANGAWKNPDFASHVAWVLASSTAVGAFFLWLQRVWHQRTHLNWGMLRSWFPSRRKAPVLPLPRE